MTASQVFVGSLCAALMCLNVAGLVVRRRARLCWTFLAYLLALILGNQLGIWLPGTFLTQWFWILKTTIYTMLQAMIALEIALLTFAGLPRARLRVALTLLAILCVGFLASLQPASSGAYPYLSALGVVAPRERAMALWLFVGVLAVAWWHRAPVHPHHRGLLLAFTLYLGTKTWLLGLVGVAAASRPAYLSAYEYLKALDPLAFAVTAGFWTWAAWRPEPERALSPAVASRLQPWAMEC